MKKLNAILGVILISTFVFSSCNNDKGGGGGGGWSAQDKSTFLNECKGAMGGDETSSKLCNCILVKMQKDYANYNDANTRGGEQLGASLRQQCEMEVNGNRNNNRDNNNNDNNNYNDDNNDNNNQDRNDNDDNGNDDEDNEDN